MPPTTALPIANGLFWNTNGAGNKKIAIINITNLSAVFWIVTIKFILNWFMINNAQT